MISLTPRGMPVSTASAAMAAATHHFEEEILNYGSRAGALLDALSLDPGCGLSMAYAAALNLFRLTRDGNLRAKSLIESACQLSAETVRERSLIAAIARWSDQDIAGATHCLSAWLTVEPRDLFAAKLLQYLLFSTGQADAMLAEIQPVATVVPDDARVLGMLAFALDQTGHHADSEHVARAAIDIAPDPWAHHALSHAMSAGGRHKEGRAWMSAHASAWADCTSFLYTHNWWHAALFHLALGDRDGALALYHERVWARRKDYAQDQINAISLLARLELAGVDVGDRWEDVAEHIRPRCRDVIDGFLDLHYAYALARAGDDAAVSDLVCALKASADMGDDTKRVALAAGQGIIAFARSDFAGAARRLAPVETRFSVLGGSNVQRQLLVDILNQARAEGRTTEPLAA